MKVKFLAAACAALGCASAFAATYDPATTVAAQTVYIAGASAQKNALYAAVPTTVFDTTSHGVLFINGANGAVGWLGDAKAAYGGGTMLVIYNSTNGSAAGLNQVISAGSPEAEAVVMASGNMTGCGAKSAVAAPHTAAEQITCTGPNAAREADVALSDVYANEFAPGLLSAGSALKAASTSASTGIEGFGVIVNGNLYDALITKNIADGLLPATCASATASTLVVGTGNGACQPSVRSADYASFVTSGGQFNSSDAFGVAANDITLCRRDDLSGTQAASNIFFLNNVCGLEGHLGAIPVVTNADSNAPTYNVVDAANVSTGKAEVCVWSGSATGTSAMTGYGIGVVSLGEKDAVDTALTKPFYFVKLDGVSPNYKANGAYDSLHRANLLNGSYKFATEMAAYVKSTTSLTTGAGKVARAIADDIAKANLSNLTGIAYLAGTADATKTARYTKGGNNCSVWQ
ncbi:hypothetical protein [Dechloromonas sp. HYN0024]|uniref:hypothetical protein n=1 Tax=Dechloromonas sp. HYN0024 TaxID=2231055 RepID=UPI000E43C1C2|nr:hypothetical protein [Dechloromonas sp. HYN0024]AXS80135.1 hypothetical protein HYN24_08945 [Dechloromonas sp. HYN0024]